MNLHILRIACLLAVVLGVFLPDLGIAATSIQKAKPAKNTQQIPQSKLPLRNPQPMQTHLKKNHFHQKNNRHHSSNKQAKHCKEKKAGSCSNDHDSNAVKHAKVRKFSHNIQLQLADSSGFPIVPANDVSFCEGGSDTRFWVTLEITEIDNLVTIEIPQINFYVSDQVSPNNIYCTVGGFFPEEGLPPSGGYLYTSAGYLPDELRPNGNMPVTVLAACNNGMSPSFSYVQDPATLPVPLTGYIVEIRNDGSLNIQASGTFGNIIPQDLKHYYNVLFHIRLNIKKKLAKIILSVTAQLTSQTFQIVVQPSLHLILL